MALYIFYVDAGQRLVLNDEYLFGGTVAELKKAIERHAHVHSRNQVVFISGGRVPKDDESLSSCDGGTESNPIYVINNQRDEWNDSAQCVADANSTLLALESELTKVAQRMQSARTMRNLNEIAVHLTQCARTALRLPEPIVAECSNLLDDQHHLNLAWQALLCNLDDYMRIVDKRVEMLTERRNKVQREWERIGGEMKNTKEELRQLGRLPVPPCLVGNERNMTLADWMRQHESELLRELDAITDGDSAQPVKKIMALCDEIFGAHRLCASRVHSEQERSMSGVQMRLQQLDEWLQSLREHAENVKSRCQEAIDVTSTRNVTLEATRWQQDYLSQATTALQSMLKMLSNFVRSKEDILKLIRQRVADWMMDLHAEMQQIQNKDTTVRALITRVTYRLRMVQQLQSAPQLFAQACAEIYRRQLFKQDFEAWSHELSTKASEVLQKENDDRRGWKDRLSRSFMHRLFACLTDDDGLVPQYACDRPSPFDIRLPQLVADDLRSIRNVNPALDSFIRVRQTDLAKLIGTGLEKAADRQARMHRAASFIYDEQHRPSSLIRSDATRGSSTLLTSYPSTTFLLDDQSPYQSPVLQSHLAQHHSKRDRTQSLAEHESLQPLSPIDLPPIESSPKKSSASIAIQRTATPEAVASSAPIAIPAISDAQKKQMNRQVSEKYGTPPEDSGASCEAASPLEMISHEMLCEQVPTPKRPLSLQTTSTSNPFFESQLSDTTTVQPTSTTYQKTSFGEAKTKLAELTSTLNVVGTELQPMIESLKEDIGTAKEQLNSAQSNSHWLELRKTLEEKLAPMLSEYNQMATRLEECKKQIVALEDSNKASVEQLRQKEANLAELQSKMRAETEVAKREIIKQLTIDYELQLDAERKEANDNLTKRDNQIEMMSREIEKCHQTIDELRSEQDRMIHQLMGGTKSPTGSLSSLSSSPVASTMSPQSTHDTTSLRHKFDMLATEIRRNHQDELMRMRKEHELEMRKLKETHKQELDALKRSSSMELVEKSDTIPTEERGTDAPLATVVADSADNTELNTAESTVQTSQTESMERGTDAPIATVFTDNAANTELHMIESTMQTSQIQSMERSTTAVPEPTPTAEISMQTSVRETLDSSMNTDVKDSQDAIMQTSAIVASDVTMQTSMARETDVASTLEPLSPERTSQSMIESSMTFDTAHVPVRDVYQDEAMYESVVAPATADTTLFAETTTTDDSNSVEVVSQTILRVCDVARRVAIYRPMVGDIVAVQWSVERNSYVLYERSNEPFIVRERSARSLGLPTPPEAEQGVSTSADAVTALRLARFTRSEYCKIKRDENRFNLPTGCYFYRVDVEPLDERAFSSRGKTLSDWV